MLRKVILIIIKLRKKTCYLTKAKKPSMSYYLHIAKWVIEKGFVSVPRALAKQETEENNVESLFYF